MRGWWRWNCTWAELLGKHLHRPCRWLFIACRQSMNATARTSRTSDSFSKLLRPLVFRSAITEQDNIFVSSDLWANENLVLVVSGNDIEEHSSQSVRSVHELDIVKLQALFPVSKMLLQLLPQSQSIRHGLIHGVP